MSHRRAHRFPFARCLAVVCLATQALATPSAVGAPIQFSRETANLEGVSDCFSTWGDYDNDGDLDLLLLGRDSSGVNVTHVYRNDGTGQFALLPSGLVGVDKGCASWGDFDGDGDLDLALSGDSSTGPVTRIYRNDSGTFSDIGAGLPGVSLSSLDWGDFDRDGDLDLLLMGTTDGMSSGRLTRVYRNDGGGNFVDTGAALRGVYSGTALWVDFTGDGLLDILTCGIPLPGCRPSGCESDLYENDGAGGWIGWGPWASAEHTAFAIGELNDSRDVDFAYCANGLWVEGFWGDNAGSVRLTDLSLGSVALGDFDNDGDQDVVFSGLTSSGKAASIFRNDGLWIFSDVQPGFTGVERGSVSTADYDNDGDLDILIAGDSSTGPVAELYRNESDRPNSPPGAPSNLRVENINGRMRISWDSASDAETSPSGIFYNLRIGTMPDADNVAPSMSNALTGFRRIGGLGNAECSTSLYFDLPLYCYYWSVQAIDASFAGSAFAGADSIGCLKAAAGESADQHESLALGSFPNPLRTSTRISFSLASAGDVLLEVFDIQGRRVRTLTNAWLGVGRHAVDWDGMDEIGHPVPNGRYYYRLKSRDLSSSKGILVLRY